jgi:hypothetical protein
MTISTTVELNARAPRFFSTLDERGFFEWLGKLACVAELEGKGDTLYIRIFKSKVDEPALRELLALFHRYGVNMKQLIAFDNADFAGWFRKRTAYWYDGVFCPSSLEP